MGGRSKKKKVVGYKVHIGEHDVLCLGPVDSLREVDFDERLAWNDGPLSEGSFSINQPNLFGGEKKEGGVVGDFDFLPGHLAQGRNTYLQSIFGAAIPAFRGLCSVVMRRPYRGLHGYLKKPSYVVSRIHIRQAEGLAQWYDEKAAVVVNRQGPPGGDDIVEAVDMNPAHILREIITDPDWGRGADESAPDEDSFVYAADMLYAEGFGLSIKWSKSTTLEEFAGEVLRHIDGVLYRDNGKYFLKLARADYDPGDLLLLDESSIIRVENLRRPQIGEMVNQVTVTTFDRDTKKPATESVTDDAMVAIQGRIIDEAIQYPYIYYNELRRRVMLRDLKTRTTPLLSCTIIATRKVAGGLRPGDVFRMTWPDAELDEAVMRIVKIGIGDSNTSELQIDCVEDVFSFPDSQIRSRPDVAWEDPSTFPTSSPNRLVFEAPYLEIVRQLGQNDADSTLSAAPEAGFLVVLASQPSGDAINAELQVDSGAGYAEVETIDFTPASALAADVGPTDTVLAVIDGLVFDDAVAGDLMLIDDEWVRFDGISGNDVTVGRGCLDTVPVEHGAGALLWHADNFMDGDDTQYELGETIAAKVLPITGRGMLDLASAPEDTVTMDQRAARPYPPGNVEFSGSLSAAEYFPSAVYGDLTVSWAHRDRLQQTSGTVYDFTEADIGPESGTTYTIEIRQDASLLESASGIAGTSYTSSIVGVRNLEVTLYSERAGLQSWQSVVHSFTLYNDDTMILDCSDETTALTAGTGKKTFRMPWPFALDEVRASLSTAQTSGSIFTVDINEGGTSILSTKITIDNGEKTSVTAAAPAVISDAALADDAEITIDIDQVGDGTAKGLKVYLIGRRTG